MSLLEVTRAKKMNIYDDPAPLATLSSSRESIVPADLTTLQQAFETRDFSLNRTPARAVRLSGMYIDPQWSFVFREPGQHVEQSVYLKPPHLIAEICAKSRPDAVRLDPRFIYFVGYNHDYANYYHWTLQGLPSLLLFRALRGHTANLRLLLPASVPRYVLQYLELLNIKHAEVQGLPLDGRLCFADELIYPSFLGGEYAFNTSGLILDLAQALLARSGIQPSAPMGAGKRVIYCSRLDSSNRKITNEADLIKTLEELKVETIVASRLDVRAQMKTFHDADIVISPHGAGLSNVLYCRKGTTVIELIPDKYRNRCFATLAIHGGCNYIPVAFPTAEAGGHQHTYRWDVPPGDIASRLIQVATDTSTPRALPLAPST